MKNPEIPIQRSLLKLVQYAVNPAKFASEVLDFHPDATQQKVLQANGRRVILNCNRQWGKSTISAILLAHRAIFSAGSLSIILGPSERQSAETLRKVRGFLLDAGVKTASDRLNRNSIVIRANDSRIVALPAADAKIRGFSKVSLLMIDEASRVSDQLYYALRPSLAVSGGDLILVSTPLGKRGFFYTEFSSGGPVWQRYTIPASQCPRISPQFLDEERAVGEEYFAQEYECEFVEDGRFLFSDADFKKLFTSDVKPLNLKDPYNPASWAHVMKPVHSYTPPERDE